MIAITSPRGHPFGCPLFWLAAAGAGEKAGPFFLVSVLFWQGRSQHLYIPCGTGNASLPHRTRLHSCRTRQPAFFQTLCKLTKKPPAAPVTEHLLSLPHFHPAARVRCRFSFLIMGDRRVMGDRRAERCARPPFLLWQAIPAKKALPNRQGFTNGKFHLYFVKSRFNYTFRTGFPVFSSRKKANASGLPVANPAFAYTCAWLWENTSTKYCFVSAA